MDWRVVGGGTLLFVLVISQGVEQFTMGKYATPPLLSDLAKILVPTLFTTGAVVEVAKRWGNNKSDVQKGTPSGDEGDRNG
jgi:hypothetical protein